MAQEEIITTADWRRILHTMQRYNRTEGYVGKEVKGACYHFYDTESSFGGIKVTIAQVFEYAQD